MPFGRTNCQQRARTFQALFFGRPQMSRLLIASWLIGFVFVAGVLADSCTWIATSGKKYDLTPATPSSDLKGASDGTPYVYYFMPCKNTQHCTTSGSAPPSPSPFCQTPASGTGVNYGCGQLAQFTQNELQGQSGFYIQYTGGDRTASGTRSVNITCQCNTKPPTSPLGPTGGVYEVPNAPPGTYQATFQSPYCCAINGPGPKPPSGGGGGFDPGWIFVIIVCCGAVVYLIAGVLVMRFVYNAEGTQMIPNVEFWASTPGLMKDGVMYVVNKIRGTSSYTTF